MGIPERLKGDPFWDEPTSFDELAAVVPGLTPAYLRSLQLTPWEMLEAGLLFIGNDNSIIEPSSTQGPKRQVTEDSALSQLSQTQVIRNVVASSVGPSVSALGNAPSGTVTAAREPRMGFFDVALTGGTIADVVLVPALAGFTGVVQPFAVWSDTVDEYSFALQDEDNSPLNPANATPVDVDIKGTNEIAPFATTHGVAGDNSGTPHECITYHGVAANKALECDISGGGGTEKVIGWFVYWYEVI